MNEAHFHLMVNHFPIIAPIIAILVMLAGFYFRSETIKRTAYGIFIVGAILAIPAFTSGGDAEEIVERIPGIDESLIETHEEIADTFAVLSYILGGISILGIWASIKQKSFSRALPIIAILFSVIVVFFAARTASSGGEIMHKEIRKGP